MKFDELKDHVDKMHQLLEDPQPGMISWNEFLTQHWKALIEGWGKPMMVKERPTKPGWYFAALVRPRRILIMEWPLDSPLSSYNYVSPDMFDYWSKEPITFPELPKED